MEASQDDEDTECATINEFKTTAQFEQWRSVESRHDQAPALRPVVVMLINELIGLLQS